MPQPPSYHRSHNFGTDSPGQIDGAAVNAELDGAASSINAIRDNLALIQRDDGALRSGIVTVDAISDTITSGIIEKVGSDIEAHTVLAGQAADAAAGSAAAAAASADNAGQSAQAAATSADAAAQSAIDAASSAASITSPAWDSIVNKPAHATRWPIWNEVANKPEQATRWPNWSEVAEKPVQAIRWPVWDEVDAKPNLIQAFAISALPTIDIGPIIVLEASEIWVWVETAYYTGYRSPLCGRPVDGHTVIALANEIDAVGGLVSKAAYAGLWGYAQENALAVSQPFWSDHIGGDYFADVSGTHFRVPDLRNQFRRYTGTNADTAYVRALGSEQLDAFKAHSHTYSARDALYDMFQPVNYEGARRAHLITRNTGQTGGTETRGVNTAFHPRIHI